MTKQEAYIAFNLLPNIGPVRVRRLLDFFEGDPCSVLTAPVSRLSKVKGIGRDLATVINGWKEHIELDVELERIADAKVTVVTPADEMYPSALREIYDPPLALYIWGKIMSRDHFGIGIVGSRRATHYGTHTARKLGFQLGNAGFTVISGLARGIDTAAHEGALASSGRTIAVIGSGLGRLYPPENQELGEKIATQGAVVSEFPMLYPPDKQSFPLRNRIISGWSKGIVVVEAPGRSGALITADQAMEQGRNVYAVPGPIDRPGSLGANRLIQQGAKLVIDAADIIEDFGELEIELDPKPDETGSESRTMALSKEESAVFGLLTSSEASIETLIDQSGLPPSRVSTVLLQLEMKRLVKQLPGKNFVKAG